MLEEDTATRARLGRVGGIDLDHLATGTFSLVRETGDEVGPARIQDAHGEAAAGHGGDPEVFEHDPIESLDQLIDELVEEIFPWLATWTIRRCSLRISLRRLLPPSTLRAIVR